MADVVETTAAAPVEEVAVTKEVPAKEAAPAPVEEEKKEEEHTNGNGKAAEESEETTNGKAEEETNGKEESEETNGKGAAEETNGKEAVVEETNGHKNGESEKRPAEDTTEGSPVKKAKISEEEVAPVAEEAASA